MATYLLTGAAGFIGSRVADLLLQANHEVVGLDNLNEAYDPRLKRWRLEQLARQAHFTFVRGDVSEAESLEEAGEGKRFDAVINLAARAGVRASVIDPRAYLDTNVIGTLNLIDYARAQGIPKFILASSSSVYGNPPDGPCNEDMDTSRPLSPYAASKKGAEALVYAYHHLHHIDISILRYFTVYGPAGRPDMSPFRFVKWISEGEPVKIFGDGSQARDFTYVDDIARGTIAALRPLGFEVINLGADRPIVLLDALAQIEAIVGKKAHREFLPADPSDVQRTWADIAKAGKLLDWRPSTPFVEGMTRLVEWYEANRSWASQINTE